MFNLDEYKNHSLVQLNMLIVEDSISYALELEQLASEIGYNVLATVDNSGDALDIIFSEHPDIIMMDVNINGRLTGIDIAKRIIHLNIPVLYVTSFNDPKTYQEALESNLIGYIVKPVDKLTLTTSLKLLIERTIQQEGIEHKPKIFKKEDDNYIFFMKNNVYQKVNVDSIAFIKSEDNYCNFTLDDDSSYLLRIKLSDVEELLTQHEFIRCHRQYIVNQKKIRKVNTLMSTLELGSNSIPYSRSKKQEIMSIGIFLK